MKPVFSSKIYSALLSGLTFAWVLFVLPLSSQVVGTDLAAIGDNGRIAIRVTNITTFSSYFSLSNGEVDLDFYFAPDDPRNGLYSGAPLPQPNGEIYVRFDSLNFQEGDSLTFIATELLQGTITKHYVFVLGNFFPESGGSITTCPRNFSCVGKGLLFQFDRAEIILDQSSITPVTLEIPSANIHTVRNSWAIDVGNNAIVLKFIPSLDCNQVMLGHATFTINGFTCHFVNGQLSCPPWTNIPENLSITCAPYFEDCLTELADLISDAQYVLPCQQWMTYGPCTTTNIINRTGKVAIGTTNSSPNGSALTVKNGIITDKVKVTGSGWADYVFEKDYPLMPLEEVEAYIAKYHHLPGTPSTDKLETDGSFELGETTINHQIKIEEIFLHLIKLEEETKGLEAVLFLHETMNRIRIKN
ncbi:MAG: hypothetical protein ACKVT2_07375 [Saprospiraceae bacterium]